MLATAKTDTRRAHDAPGDIRRSSVLFSFNFQTWLWAPLFVCTASIGIVKLLPKTVNEWIAWVGTISAALFVLHPLTRKIFIPISRHGDVYTGLLLYIVASIALAWFYHNFKLRNEDTKH